MGTLTEAPGAPSTISERGPWRPDAVSVVTLLMVSVFVVPARFTVPALGGLGRPDIVLGVGLLVWWCVTRTVPSLTVRDRQPLRIVVVLLMLALMVAAAMAYQRGLTSLEASGLERTMIGWFSSLGILLVCLDGINSMERLNVLLKRIVLLGLVGASVAVIQFFFGFDLTPQLKPPGFSANLDLRSVELRSVVARVYGTSLHPIEFGVLMSVVGALSAHFAFVAVDRAERQWRWVCTAVILGSGLLSVSRSAVVAMAILLLGYLLVWRPRMWLNGIAVGLVGLAAMRLIAPGLLGTLRALFEHIDDDPSIAGRTNDYAEVFTRIEESFWWGRGPGTWNVEEYFVLDNQWLVQLVTTGFFVTMLFAALLIGGMAQAAHVARRGRSDDVRLLGHTLMLVLLVFAVTSFFFDSMAYPQIRTFTFVVLGCAGALWKLDQRQTGQVTRRGGRRLLRSSRSVQGEAQTDPGSVLELASRPDPSRSP